MSSSACVPNIGPAQRRRRLHGGIASGAAAAGLALFLIAIGAPRAWRLLVAFPALGAGLGIFQARAQTCVALAARGLRNMDDGDRAVADAGELDRLRTQSRRVYLQALALAAVATAAALLIA
jgi:hypothetical protein